MPWPPSAGTRCSCLAGGMAAYHGETWVYDLSANTWTNQAPAAGPSARYWPCHGLARRGPGAPVWRVRCSGYHGETWVYDLSDNTWTNQAPAAGPSARALPCHGLPRRGPGAPVWRGRWRPVTVIPGSMTSAPTPGRTRPPPPARPHELPCHGLPRRGPGAPVWRVDGSRRVTVRPGSMTSAPTPGRTRPPPPPRPHDTVHAMASLGGDQVLLFGGYDGSL